MFLLGFFRFLLILITKIPVMQIKIVQNPNILPPIVANIIVNVVESVVVPNVAFTERL